MVENQLKKQDFLRILMEKAMWSAIVVGYEMYCSYHSVRMEVAGKTII
jgi:hypothetical protein